MRQVPSKTSNKIEVFFRLETLKLKEEIQDLYIYQDFNTGTFSVYYNDELKFPVNIQKTFYKKYGKVKNYFDIIEDVLVEYRKEEKLIKLTYVLNK